MRRVDFLIMEIALSSQLSALSLLSEKVPDLISKLLEEALPGKGERRLAQASVIEGNLRGSLERAGQAIGIIRPVEDAVDAVTHDVERSSSRERDDGGAAGQGLDRRHAEVLLAR